MAEFQPEEFREDSGEQARMLESLPMKLFIVDRRIAMLPAPIEPGALVNGVMVVRASALLDALVALFETLWERATPISLARSEVPATPGNGEALADKLVPARPAGQPDGPGVGPRVVRRPETAADTPLSLSTPLPSKTRIMTFSSRREDSTGRGVSAGTMQFSTPVQVYVSPTPAAEHGRSRFSTEWYNIPPKGTSPYYWHDAPFVTDRIPSDGTYRMTDANTVTVRNHMYRSGSGIQNGLGVTPIDPRTGPVTFGFGALVDAPATATQYFGTGNGGLWMTDSGEWDGDATSFADPMHFEAGRAYDIDWMRGPIAPKFGTHHNAAPQVTDLSCLACQAGDQLVFSFNRAGGDSDPSHGVYLGGGWTSRMTLSRNGEELSDTGIDDGGIRATVPAGSATYHVVADTSRSAEHTSPSTDTHTELIFRTPQKPIPGSELPAGTTCIDGDTLEGCQILQVLNLDYDLPADLRGNSTARRQQMYLTVNHLSYEGKGSKAPAEKVTVEVSFDGGKTWTQAHVNGTVGDRFHTSWTNAGPQGTASWLRVTATDSIGGSITQTVANATASRSAGEGHRHHEQADIPCPHAGSRRTGGHGEPRGAGRDRHGERRRVDRDKGEFGPGTRRLRQGDQYRCLAELRTDVSGGFGVRGKAAASTTGLAASLPPGFGPADLQAAYKLVERDVARRGACRPPRVPEGPGRDSGV
ncbi:hypothetical protein [Streptomyces sp. NPDC047725]|uniref:hypothetical protein n=1 Tax=Streptomyces sp. NPDC047725 TaxID=3365487 RepID=UPI0037163785